MMQFKTKRLRSWPRKIVFMKVGGLVLAMVSLVLPGLTFADWEFYPVLRAAADFDDNASLTTRTDEVNDISGFIGEARLGIAYYTPTGLFYIEPILRSRRYDSAEFLDSDDQFLNFRMQHNGEFNTLSLHGNYSRESVRTAELADADLETDIDPDEIEDDDTGRVDLRQRRERLFVVPRWRYRMSSKSTLVADVSYLTVDFDDDDQQVVQLVDYTDVRARLGFERSISARNKGLLVATARNYKTDFLDGDFTGYGLSIGFDRALTENSTFRALVGVEKSEQINVTDEEPHVVADISLVRRQETTRLLVQYRRRVSPSGAGALAVRDEVNLRFTRDLTDTFTAGIGARAYQSNRLGIVENEIKYVQLNAQVLWQFSRAFSFQANYRHTVIDRSLIGESADSNRVTLWINYQPNTRSRIRLGP